MSFSFRRLSYCLVHLLMICLFYRSLKKVDPKHAFLADLEEKSQLFDTAASKFSAKVSA